jgi:cytochrome P450
MLCLNPDMQTRLRQEIRKHLPSIEENVNITSQQVDHMPYLNAVCSEVLRYVRLIRILNCLLLTQALRSWELSQELSWFCSRIYGS